MLVLTRRRGESIIINDDIIITMLNIKAHQVRLGIHAPKEVRVLREEIYNYLKQTEEQKTIQTYSNVIFSEKKE